MRKITGNLSIMRILLCLFICLIAFSASGNTTAEAAGKNTAAASIKLSKTKVSVYKNKTVTLKAVVSGKSKKITWKSSNNKIAAINSKGVVTAKKVGKAVISATANGRTAKCTVTVKEKISSRKRAQHQKYVTYIKKFDQKNKKSMKQYKGIMYTGSLSVKTYFAFMDIDRDGTDECIVKFTSGVKEVSTGDGEGGQIGRTEIYTIKNGKVKAVVQQDAAFCGDYPGISVYKDSKLIEFYTSGHSLTSYDFYEYTNGRLSKKAKYSCGHVMGGGYFVESKTVTKKKFEAYLKKQRKKCKKDYPMYEYTTENIKKFL